MQYGIGSANV